ncbi:MAG: ferredoxin [Jatrophihabitantaceae bacterium]
MRVVVDYDRCDGNALCTAIAPTLFQLDDSGDLKVRSPIAPRSLSGLGESDDR